MNIKIMARKEIEKLIKNGFPKDVAVISFKDTDDDSIIPFKGLPKYLFELKVDDIYFEELGELGLDADEYFLEADDLARFIKEVVSQNVEIICQCEYGQSRSAACAAAILEFYEGKGIDIFADYRYYPNKYIYNKLIRALRRK